MSDKFFDVRFTIMVSGYEKSGWGRVCADDPLEAVVSAIVDEVHFIEDDEVVEQVKRCWREHKSLLAISVEDEDFKYTIDDVVELQVVPVKVNGQWTRILVPKEGLETRSKLPGAVSYFEA